MKRYLVLILILAGIVISSTSYAQEMEVKRIFGQNRYETSVEVSKNLYEKKDTVIIALGEDFPDALVGGTLSVQLDLPILLSRRASIDDVVIEEVERLDAKKAYILGGEAAVGEVVEEKLEEMDLEVERVAGANRFKTAEEIAMLRFKLRPDPKPEDTMGDEIYYINAYNFPDALAAAPFVGQTASYLYPIEKERDAAPGIAIGGPAVIKHSSDNNTLYSNLWILDETGENILDRPYRIFGPNRYRTAVEVAHEHGYVFKNYREEVILVSGKVYPDALSAAPLVLRNKGVVLLTDPLNLSPETKKYLEDVGIRKVTIVGGTSAVSENVVNQLKEVQAVVYE